ncbi:glycoside hydrolase family 125 protein [Flavobacterium sp. MAH-1]|uniref:Glycoside hydrolase family 125 protein n=1 Tax=Flavobacterium agri TaxID=2743471 RepID=A0A7Y8XZ31_9FLAO|nr:glycoside hydrolase family 125 protein [Flavobacterium agri]NUY79544.1 glycoside hydrolase family 125 protein [Flavobacterium agri]NYA69569.1 glycoside hydrolase family 125 protein [Flavobacterium agri]
MKRRHFLQTSALATLGAYLIDFLPSDQFPVVRVPKSKRKFTSASVEKLIASMKTNLRNPELAWLFENCFPNTLDTTVDFSIKNNKPDTFVITGDIHAMWLRDSTAQVMPYLTLAKQDLQLRKLLAGVINRQAKCIRIDPYANAFNKGATGSEWKNDLTEMKPELHERKWEIDSLCYPIRLSYHYWKQTKDVSPFDQNWHEAMKLVVETFRVQQRKNGKGPYSFMRSSPRSIDTPPLDGYGFPIKPVGLIASMFRPSDDATVFPFLVPSNYFAVVSLRQLSEMATQLFKDKELQLDCIELASEVESALKKYAIVDHPDFGKVFAYEVDGFGNRLYMDDANAPSLLSMPYFGSCAVDDPVYVNTRRMILSPSNPYYYEGKAAKGIGAPHTPENYIWHIGLIMQALTSVDDNEIRQCLHILKTTHAGTGFMHESFHKDDPKKFTRSWFAWANTLFGELIWKIQREKPHLLAE